MDFPKLRLTTLRPLILLRIATGASKYLIDAEELYFWELLIEEVALLDLLRC